MKFRNCIFIVAAIVITSCKHHKSIKPVDNRSYKFDSKLTLVSDKKISFLLDSLTNPNINNIQLFKTDSITYLTFLNKQFNSIYFYDFATSKYKFKVAISTSGVNSVGPLVNSYFIKSLDSIYVLSRYVLNIIDREGHIHYKKNFFLDHPGDFTALPQMYCYAPLIAKGDTLLINCIPDKTASKEASFEGKECMIRFNTKTGQSSYTYQYPDVYRDGVYGVNYMVIYHTYNPDTKRIIFSFPADNNIYVSNGDELNSKYAGSKTLDIIKPMPQARDDFESYNLYYLRSPSYGPIYYDKFRKVYYRFALKPITEADYKAKRWWKRKSIVILDQTFKKVGEIDVPDTISFLSCFVNEEGLYAGTDDGNDKISITLYKLKAS